MLLFFENLLLWEKATVVKKLTDNSVGSLSTLQTPHRALGRPVGGVTYRASARCGAFSEEI